MFKTLLSTVFAMCGLLMTGTAFSQDFNAMNAEFNARLNAQMQAGVNNIVQTNLNDPHVQQMYQVYLQQGGQLNFQSYCFRYAETGGFNPQATNNMINQSWAIHRRDQANYSQYADESRRLRNDTYAYRDAVHQRQARQRGEGLTARANFENSADGSSHQLPTNLWPGQNYRDPYGNVFHYDIHGRYWMYQNDGWQEMNYQN